MHRTQPGARTDRQTPSTGPSIQQLVDELQDRGVAPIRGAFPTSWADQLAEDFSQLVDEALQFPGGTAPRGPNRHYFAVHPERVRGFVDLATHPTLCAVAETVLGPEYQLVELAFDVPLPGAVDQPWHRDFPMPPETRIEHRLTSLAFNLTTVDVAEDMGPFEVAPGTQFDDDADFTAGMFPNATDRYEALARRSYPRRGDMSVRSALTIHHGTANTPRRVLAVCWCWASSLRRWTRRDRTTSCSPRPASTGCHRSCAGICGAGWSIGWIRSCNATRSRVC